LFINDIQEIFGDGLVKAKMFADDVKIYCKVPKSKKEASLLTAKLLAVEKWARKWQLRLNIDKCVVLSLGKNNPKREYFIDGQKLQTVDNFRDLGIIVSSNLKFSAHCNSIATKALRTIGMIFRTFISRNPKTLVRAYKTYVRPLVESCTAVFSPHMTKDIRLLERVQHIFTNRLFWRCFGTHDPYARRCETLELQSLEFRRTRYDLTMCFKILTKNVLLDETEFFVRNDTQLRGHSKKLKHFDRADAPDCRKYFFCNRVIDIFNMLPQYVLDSPNVNCFLARMDRWFCSSVDDDGKYVYICNALKIHSF
jgi:hypothetical protein